MKHGNMDVKHNAEYEGVSKYTNICRERERERERERARERKRERE